ncbi:MAG: segregation/condensation protein A [Rhodospirillales bacterium]|jgi:segregation and condensation protein A|nr:segregation/condensation protein A [Rhodospirillales bacterium]MBT4006994.1 segregation/condensation protein A [Rhodospirillales bacterium]MBT5076027.1 segregation/condensation protein A [Rhodospirillales bacterium]MBT5112854.1 segregation/condensation protein A [Rhodospirillales bacterium]MBT5673625.1 segregation/condensation protein A [Rhodospirillales bacterium]
MNEPENFKEVPDSKDSMPAPDAVIGLEGQLLLDLDGFEGPIDLLLTLARDQKVDITKISILALADQYLAFIAHAQRISLEVAADYLVTAAWLAYLKSRLLLPVDNTEEQPTGQQMADALAFQLRRLESMQKAGVGLFDRSLMGRDVFAHGMTERTDVVTEAIYEPSLYELLRCYGQIQSRETDSVLHITPQELYSVEQAVDRLRSLLGQMPDWGSLSTFLPENLKDGILMRSALASTFAATLELVRQGHAELRQDGAFRPIYIRARNRED